LISTFRDIINRIVVSRNVLYHWKSIQYLNSGRLVFFSHFDKEGEIKPYVIYYLNHLIKLDCNIVFISTSENLSRNAIATLEKLCISIIIRKNIGLDFGSWKTGIFFNQKNFNQYESIILANDSCYAPVFNLEPIFEQFNNKKNTISGITISSEAHRKPHIQSYFVWFNKEKNNYSYLIDFFSKVRFLQNKRKIIKKYEVGLTQNAIHQGFNYESWVDNISLKKKYHVENQNHTIENSILLLKNDLSPMIKCAIFKDMNLRELQIELLQILKTKNMELFKIIKSQIQLDCVL